MAKKIECFEDLVVWQEARSLTRKIYTLNKKIEKKKDWRLGSQITSASVSIMNNIAEGFESATDKRFANYLDIAKGSCGELRSMLYVALDNGYINDTEFNELYEGCIQLSKRLYKFKTYLDRTPK
jgi:four helix bundle protein